MSTNGTKKKKKSIVKSIAKGLSFKKKKERPDDESVVGVAIDRGVPAAGRKQNPSSAVSQSTPSVPSTPSASSAITSSLAKPIQVVLLLMDPSSRRFELLQLEFDSNKAMVSDVIRQIQSSATETTLRDMTYIGVCDIHGVEMIASMKLSKFCKGNDVVMALPRGMSGRETAKLAGPILGDRKVEEMLAPIGIKIPKVAKKTSRAAAPALTQIAEENNNNNKLKENTTKDIKKKAPSPKAKSQAKPADNNILGLPIAVWGIIISIIGLTIRRHISVTSPIKSGDLLLPGKFKSQCGIYDLFPEKGWCAASSTSSTLELGSDGTLRYFTKSSSGDDGKRSLVWSVAGGKEEAAKFEKEGYYWYVTMGGTRTTLNKDVIRDFMVN